MPTFKEVLETALREDKLKLVSINRRLIELAKSTKKRPGYVKAALNDEAVDGFIRNRLTGFIVYGDGDELNEIANRLAAKKENHASS